jgi:hypothetical protein
VALLTKAQVLAAEDRRYESVSVPEWGGELRVGVMTAVQRDRYFTAALKSREEGSDESIQALAVALCAVDETGAPIFTIEDAIGLGAKSGVALDRVFRVAARLNGLLREAVEEAKGN